jgi:type III secretory pathway component EscV
MPENKNTNIPPDENNWIFNFFIKSNTLYAQIRAMVFGACILWLLLKQDFIPLIIWILLSLIFNIIGILYWRAQAKKYSDRMKEIDKEIQKLNEQIKEKREYFKKLKEEYLNKP